MAALDISFIRTVFLQPLLTGLEKHYGINHEQLGIPARILKEPMSLIPFSEVVGWLEHVEKLTGNPAFMINIANEIKFDKMGYLGEWFLSSPDLALAFRRINYGTSCLQSGATFHGEQSGNIIKWSYSTRYAKGRARLHDSLRMAIMFNHALKHYMGDNYVPINVEISGPPCGNGLIESYFGTEIQWNAPMTKVWVDISILEHGNNKAFNVTRPMLMSNLQLDDFLNMPQPHDLAKVMFEMVNYSRYYGVPNIDFVADRVGLSRQQLQRRLHQYGWNFTSITSYVLCNSAIKYMMEGMPITEIAAALGYSNVQSFNKAFQRNRGNTPAQYQQRLLERSRT
ncbi:AraC family transcriptional regulator [Photobacterium lipolyticum]|uniref:AraC family transcriptional regulator n=1 Tax=Photobacterium lipolyticum TaxID=266810 RepID=A0A2T3MSL1_9GAMM|nr:AraC family transcriptional regulator [Photobacterium lipolyticum]PSW00661.1 AraC family transcriptional regulator [Photobacterium lipolyticum]